MTAPWPASEDIPEATPPIASHDRVAARDTLLEIATRAFVGLADVRWLTAAALGEERPPVEPSTMAVLRLVQDANLDTLTHIADVLDELRLVLSILLAGQGVDLADRPPLPPAA